MTAPTRDGGFMPRWGTNVPATSRWMVILAAASGGCTFLADNSAAAGATPPAATNVGGNDAATGPSTGSPRDGGSADGITCQGSDVLEGEFESGHGCGIPVDTFNGGCDSDPHVFSPIECGQTVCGSGASDGVKGDSDWYTITITTQTEFTWSMLESSFDWFIAIVSIHEDCAAIGTHAFRYKLAGETGSCTATLLPGTYSLTVDVWPRTTPRACPSLYRVRLDCVEYPAPANDLCANAVALDVPSSTLGSNVGALADPDALPCGVPNSGRGVWYSFTGTGTTVTATTCSPNTTMNTRLLVNCGGCDNLFCVGGNDDDFVCTAPGYSPRGRRSTVSFCTTAGMTYWIVVASGAGAEGAFELILSEDGVPCGGAAQCEVLPVDCQKGDAIEGEFEGGFGCGVPVDAFNGGCNSVPEVYGTIECGQTICGSAEWDGFTRDTDWYLITVTNSNTFTWSMLESSFDWVLIIADITLGCSAPVEVPTARGRAGHSGSLTATLGPGTYRMFVAPDFTDKVACPSGYRVSLSCDSPCTETCKDGSGEIENETDCGLPVDTVNGGCSSVPPVFSHLKCPGDYTWPTCATVALDGDNRDTDWYVFTQSHDCQLSYSFEVAADFPFVAGYVEWEPGFEGSGDCAFITGQLNPFITGVGDCTPQFLDVSAGGGTHWLFVAPLPGSDVSCTPGSRNRYTITCYGGGGGADCNKNCIADNLDIASGFSNDCFDYSGAIGAMGGPNGIPDDCECVGDWNRDGLTNSTDVLEFINTYFADQGSGRRDGDVNCDATSNSTDVSDFINLWFAAQAGQLPFSGCSI